MKFKEIINEKLKRKYEFTLKALDLNKEVDQQLEKEQPSIQMKGFRKGKVPISLLKKMHGEALLSEAMKSATDTAVKDHFEKKGDKPAYEPKIELINKEWKSGDDVELSIEYECMPEIPKFDLSKLVLDNLIVEPDKKSIDDAMKKVQESSPEYKTVKKGVKSKNKDQVTLDFEGFIDGKPFENGSGQDFPLVLGSNSFIPGFEDQLIGAKPEEHVTVNVPFPVDYPSENLKGKDAVFEVDIKEIRERVDTPIDDELAKSLGLESLDQLKDGTRQQLEQNYNMFSRNRLKRELLDKLDEAHQFEVPPGMVETESEAIWQQFEEARRDDRLEDDDKEKSEDELKEEYGKIAGRRVRLGLLLAEIGRINNIEVSAEEVNQAMLQEVRKYPGQERQVMEYFQQNQQAMAGLRAPIFEDKVVDFILEMAVVSERSVTPEELMADPDAPTEEAEAEADKKPARKKTTKKKPAAKAKAKAKDDAKEES